MSLRCLIALGAVLLLSAPAGAGGMIMYGPGTIVDSASLPREIKPPEYLAEKLDPFSFDASLKRLPVLVLDGATLSISATSASGSGYFGAENISVSKMVLKNGAKIVTNGVNLIVNASEFEWDNASIVSFDDRISGNGIDRLSGRSGGTVLLNAIDVNPRSLLTVDLSGQPGEPGQEGAPGSPGAQGLNGEPALEELLNCRRSGKPGSPGGQGGPGGPGGRGGDGGNGGYLVLRGPISAFRAEILFTSNGGQGGAGGHGGRGGPGGRGGRGGNGSHFCSGGKDGPSGSDGVDGPPGSNGAIGEPGSIRAELE